MGPQRRPTLNPAPARGCLLGASLTLYRLQLYQTGDLGAMDAGDAALAARVPQLLSLRAAIYGDAFRAFVQEVTGCGPLSEKTDCSCNLYVRGSHLLCHDDVIGTRRVSYIIYLSEPDEGWERSDGGALELYALAQAGVAGEPAVRPCAALLPLWNSMAFFTVQPGRSFHAVEEVFADSKLRLSISGWFHAAAPPADAALASLAQLTSAGGGDDTAAPFAPVDLPLPPAGETDEAALAPPALTAAEEALLGEWVSGEYLQAEAQARVRRRFMRDNSVQLRGFLRADRAAQLAAAAAAADAAAAVGRGVPPPSHDAGVGAGWRLVGPPHKQRFLQYDAAAAGDADASAQPRADAVAAAAAGALLAEAAATLFASPAMAKLLWALTALRPTAVRSAARRFRPGLDYTVAHHGVLTRAARLDATLVTAAEDGGGGDTADAEAWRSGEVGGFEAYLAADESAEGQQAADVYRVDRAGAGGDDDDGGLLSVSAAPNTLSLVHRRVCPGLLRLLSALLCMPPHHAPVRCCSRATLQAAYQFVPRAISERLLRRPCPHVARSEQSFADITSLSGLGTLLLLSLCAHALLARPRDEGIMRFVRYVSAAAPGSRWDVSAEYEVLCPDGPSDDDEDEDEDEDEEEGEEGGDE